MQAWLLPAFTGIQNLQLAELPEPAAGPGEVLLRVHFAALNPADRYLAEGQYPARPPLPHILGRDGIGMVTEVGPGVHGILTGEKYAILRGEVGVSRPGTFAQRVAVPAESLISPPPLWTDEEAAGATLVYLTAYQALTQWGALPPGVLLITGASGGVGTASLQLGKALGHTVAALSRSANKRSRLTQLGADVVLDPADPDWPRQLKQSISPRRVDLAIDNIGGELFSQVLDTLGEGGKVSVVGRLAGEVPAFNTAALLFRRLRVGGVAVGAYTNAESRSAWSEVLALLAKTGAKPLLDAVFPFAELPAAFAKLASGPMGKVLLRVGG